MNILVVGSGGREHALAWKIAASPLCARLVCAPGNPGMAALAEVRDLKATDTPGLVALAQDIAADLVVIGPESAVAAALADRLAEVSVPCFGPTAAAGRLETSKAFAKRFALRHGLPIGRFGVFTTAASAKEGLKDFNPPYVVKADGPAAGKGVVVASSLAEARTAIEEAFGGRFGEAGGCVLLEEFLEGEIASVFALCDGRTSVMFEGAQDHKRAFDGELGPNTGGMGAYSPAPVLSTALVHRVRRELVDPAFAGIAADGAPYRGALFCELMATADGPKLVEFNARFGDPECQAMMLRLESDIVPYLAAAAEGRLDELSAPQWRKQTAIAVVLAARGYPDNPQLGTTIRGADQAFGSDVVVFHAGTRRAEDGALIAAGGRALTVCALGADLVEARERAYGAIDRIDWPGGFCRRDIGWRALDRASL